MGWTGQHATYYTPNGEIDSKKECDSLIAGTKYTVLKSLMVGKTYYAAVRRADGTIFAAVFRTSVDKRSYINFYYNDDDETVGPYDRKCPESILSLLTPTDSEWANKWRQDCHDYNSNRRVIQSARRRLDRLPVDTNIRFLLNGNTVICKKQAARGKFKGMWWLTKDGCYFVRTSRIPADFEVLS